MLNVSCKWKQIKMHYSHYMTPSLLSLLSENIFYIFMYCCLCVLLLWCCPFSSRPSKDFRAKKVALGSNTFTWSLLSSSDQRPFVGCPWNTALHPVLDASVIMKKVGVGGVIGLPFTKSMFNNHHLSSAKGLWSNIIDTSWNVPEM